jgi:hypothetical protein
VSGAHLCTPVGPVRSLVGYLEVKASQKLLNSSILWTKKCTFLYFRDCKSLSDFERKIPLTMQQFTGPTTVMENNKREIYFLNLLFPKLLLKQTITHGSTLRQHQTKIGTQPIQRKSRLLLVFKLSWVFYNPLPKTCIGTKINCSISQLLK